MHEDNGILASVPGESIAAGIDQLPRAGADQQGQPLQKTVVTGVRDLGAVCITYQLNTYRRGRSRLWHWVAVHAQVQPPVA